MARGCGDCGAADPSWASVNRGILLCAECCSVHRSMGRHISHVKSLHQGTWPPTLLTMVNVLTVQNANSIWEHTLLDPVASKHLRKKPQPKDPLHPAKTEFIQAKHQRLAFVFRPRKDDIPCSPTDLNKQLHSSVRSASLDTSLRLLVQGADPNYFSQEKGTYCLHVACRTGNSSQAELLVAWGADPNVRDFSGNTPSALAKLNGHIELADRMLELVYEVTDRLSYHLCNRKPNHKSGEHYIVFDKDSRELTEVAKTARGKLQLLPNQLFEELVMDIYDEIDRRECEAVWMSNSIGLERLGVAFLPVNPALSAPRNQGRQKLATLSTSEMSALLKDILTDALRRRHIATLKPNSLIPALHNRNSKGFLKQISLITDDEPLYDSVASDDDYASVLPVPTEDKPDNAASKPENVLNVVENERKCEISDEHIKMIETLREQLNLQNSTILELQSKVESLQGALENVTAENIKLKNSVERRNSFVASNSPPTRDVNVLEDVFNDADIKRPRDYPNLFESRNLGRNQRPISMFETRESSKLNLQFSKNQFYSNDQTLVESPYNTLRGSSSSMPAPENVHKYIEFVTRGIQDLWGVMKDPVCQSFANTFSLKADNIKKAVYELMSLFPKKCNDNITEVLHQIMLSCNNLEMVCTAWSADSASMDGALNNIRSAAIELVKAAKVLLCLFPIDTDI